MTIAGFAFVPAGLTIAAGTTVTWVNQDAVPHAVAPRDGLFPVQTLDPSGSYAYTFSTPGSYAYSCAIHPFMTATIIVQ